MNRKTVAVVLAANVVTASTCLWVPVVDAINALLILVFLNLYLTVDHLRERGSPSPGNTGRVWLWTTAALALAVWFVPTQFPLAGRPNFFNTDFAWPVENWQYATLKTAMEGHLWMDATSAYWRSWGNPNRPDLGVTVPAQPHWPLWIGQMIVIAATGGLLAMLLRTRERRRAAMA